MSEALTDKTGETVTVELDEARGAYVIRDAAGTDAGRAFFLTAPDGERVLPPHRGRRGIGWRRANSKVLVAQSLKASREQGVTVVPVCPLFVRKLSEAGDG